LLFNEDSGLRRAPKGGCNNVYLYLPHRLLDPVSDEVKQRVRQFLNTTFWNNGRAFECCLAAMTLALRGDNVDRAFWGIGSGGVGQSLQTAHLEAILGAYHTCLDMNIYFSDDEMRKQAANLVGKIVVTGQESVQGSSRSMREDVYKKHISADKVPERLPYAIQTTLVELRGWKRFELNSLPRLLDEETA
jgi:phage/plasmid-associated DNA primase